MNLVKKIFFDKIDSLASAAIVLGFFSLGSKILGLIRDRILYGTFGAGDNLDTYYAAFRIPDTIFNLLIIGALTASFVPMLSKYFYQKEDERAWKTVNDILNLLIIGIIFSGIILAIFAPVFLKLIVPGWSGEKFSATLSLTRIMLLSPVFLTASSIIGAVLQSTKRFTMFALAPVAYNAGIIIGAVFFAKPFGIYGVAIGVILGSLFHFLVQLPVLISLGYRYKFSFGFGNPDIKKVFRAMPPRTLSLGVGQINIFVITSVASLLASGSLAIFNLVGNIHGIFFGLIGISFSVAAFPVISAYLANGEKEKFTDIFSRTAREIIFFIIPATVFIIIFKSEIVHFVGGGGKIDYVAAGESLVFLALGLAAQSLVSLVVRTFWALGDTKTPFYTSLFGMAANFLAAVWLARDFGVAGLAIAFSLTNIVDFLMLAFFLRRKINYLDETGILNSSGKIFIASAASGAAVWFLIGLFPVNYIGISGFALATRLAFGFLITALSFSFFAWLFKVKELYLFAGALKRRLVNVFAVSASEVDEGRGKI